MHLYPPQRGALSSPQVCVAFSSLVYHSLFMNAPDADTDEEREEALSAGGLDLILVPGLAFTKVQAHAAPLGLLFS